MSHNFNLLRILQSLTVLRSYGLTFLRSYLLVIFFLLINWSVCGQNVITGTVSDEQNIPIAYASVLLLHPADSSMIAYGLTDDDGKFSIATEKKGNYLLQARCMGFVTQYKNITLNHSTKNRIVDFILKNAQFQLETVEVVAEKIGIQFKEDTIRYHVETFMDGTEKVLEDVLNKLPGIEVEDGGVVKAHGKPVEKVLLNGQDFYSGNTTMATKNIPSEIVENVDVLHNYSDYSLLKGFQSHEETVLNVGVKKEKLGRITGNVTAAGGYLDKYLFKGNVMQILPKVMFSFLGAVNNTGDEVFSFDEYLRLQGGIQTAMNAPGGSGGFSLSGDEIDLLLPENNTFERTSGLAAFNIAYQPNSKLKLNSYILSNKTLTNAEERNKTTYIVPNMKTHPISFSEKQTDNKKDIFGGMLRLDYQPSKATLLSYQGNATFSGADKRSGIFNQMNGLEINAFEKHLSKTPSTKQYLVWMQSIGKHLLTADVAMEYRDNDYSFDFQSDSLILPLTLTSIDNWYFARQNRRSIQSEGKTSIAFLYRFRPKYFLKTALHAGFNHQKYESDIFQNNPDTPLLLLTGDSLQNSCAIRMEDYCADAILTKNKGFFQFKAGFATHLYQFYHDISYSLNDKTTFRITPVANLSLFFSENHVLSLSYSENLAVNPVEHFATGMILSDYQSYIHQSALQKIYNIRQNIELSYRLTDLFSKTTFLATGRYFLEKDASTLDFRQQGFLTEYRSANAKSKQNIFANLMLEKGFLSFPWTVSVSSFYQYHTYSNRSENIRNEIATNRISGNIEIKSHYKKFFNIELSAKVENLSNKSSALSERYTQWIQNYAAIVKFKINDRLRTEVSFEYALNDAPDYRKNFFFLNSSIQYELVKKKLDLELSGVNMLNLKEQSWFSIAYRDAYMIENHFRKISGNILLNLRYKFG